MAQNGHDDSADSGGGRWYDLFSRGSRDWLRHNDKVRDAVRRRLADLASEADVLTGGESTVQVPVRFLEHYRFRLDDRSEREGVGQGQAKPGDRLRPGREEGQGGEKGGGNDEGGVEFVLEFKVDELIDWLWEELKLPHLEPRPGTLEEQEYTREGWDRRGPRARLDRRRTMREAVKRRAVQPEGPAFTNEDLRYRQLRQRPQPAAQAVVFCAMDVSSSVTERERRLAKSFFFWALQGLRRQYRHIETVFVAHTVHAWEFPEEEFFRVRGQGGTVASTAFNKVREAIAERFDPARYNIYLFYASDGENFRDDREPATQALEQLAQVASYIGYLETGLSISDYETETSRLFARQEAAGAPVASYPISREEHVWAAIRHFFRSQSMEHEAK